MTQEQEKRLKEIGERVEDSREFLGDIHPGAMQDRLLLYDLIREIMEERDEARQIAKEYRDSDGAESWYRDSTTDPLPWEPQDV